MLLAQHTTQVVFQNVLNQICRILSGHKGPSLVCLESDSGLEQIALLQPLQEFHRRRDRGLINISSSKHVTQTKDKSMREGQHMRLKLEFGLTVSGGGGGEEGGMKWRVSKGHWRWGRARRGGEILIDEISGSVKEERVRDMRLDSMD
jgi:hypothetical protein